LLRLLIFLRDIFLLILLPLVLLTVLLGTRLLTLGLLEEGLFFFDTLAGNLLFHLFEAPTRLTHTEITII
jgi:hypothetical protein